MGSVRCVVVNVCSFGLDLGWGVGMCGHGGGGGMGSVMCVFCVLCACVRVCMCVCAHARMFDLSGVD